MEILLRDGKNFILRFDKGQEVVQGLADFMRRQNFLACVFSGIGSADELELGYYDERLKSYQKIFFSEGLEALSLSGNGSFFEGQPAVHAHGVFGRKDFSTVGGHVFKLLTSATCELYVTALEGDLERKHNPDFNLNLLV